LAASVIDLNDRALLPSMSNDETVNLLLHLKYILPSLSSSPLLFLPSSRSLLFLLVKNFEYTGSEVEEVEIGTLRRRDEAPADSLSSGLGTARAQDEEPN
jgi:hypothetical protein